MAYGVGKSIQQRKNLLPAGRAYAERFNGGILFLRSPHFHYRKLRQHFGNYEDWTAQKLLRVNNDPDSYDNSSPKRICMVMAAVFRLPVLGRYLASLLRFGFIIQTVSVKNP